MLIIGQAAVNSVGILQNAVGAIDVIVHSDKHKIILIIKIERSYTNLNTPQMTVKAATDYNIYDIQTNKF